MSAGSSCAHSCAYSSATTRSALGSGGTCVPGNGLETHRRLYTGNAASSPDGWMPISWNEFFENTYIEPSLRYGTIDALRNLRRRDLPVVAVVAVETR